MANFFDQSEPYALPRVSATLFCFLVLDVYDFTGDRVNVDLGDVLGLWSVNLKGPDEPAMFSLQFGLFYGSVRNLGQCSGLRIGLADFGLRLERRLIFGFTASDQSRR